MIYTVLSIKIYFGPLSFMRKLGYKWWVEFYGDHYIIGVLGGHIVIVKKVLKLFLVVSCQDPKY